MHADPFFICFAPFGNLQRISEDVVARKHLLVDEPPDGVVGELLHQEEGLLQVEEHGEAVVLSARAHSDALRQQHAGRLLQPTDLHP